MSNVTRAIMLLFTACSIVSGIVAYKLMYLDLPAVSTVVGIMAHIYPELFNLTIDIPRCVAISIASCAFFILLVITMVAIGFRMEAKFAAEKLKRFHRAVNTNHTESINEVLVVD
uniref:Uncharacterized protein n=1 Tax=Guadeloupe mosquito mononega-like virus TaxID=2607732 RepID=A0A5C1K331_9MONO|nr:hypothetical protein [Guadeloupe mosquito mononega-like virus]